MRLACTLEYKGTNYHGFQDQADLLTVQGQINRALKKISIEPESFNYSGRTDAGVHALGQVFDFDVEGRKLRGIRGFKKLLGDSAFDDGGDVLLPQQLHLRCVLSLHEGHRLQQ